MSTNTRAPDADAAPASTERRSGAPARRPPWFETLVADFTSGVANTFLLHGGVFDYVQDGRTVREYVAEAFGALKDVVAYSPDEGITFPLASTRRRFEEVVGLGQAAGNEAYAFLRGAEGTGGADGAPLPTQPLPAVRLLLEFLLGAEEQKAVSLVERLDLLVPAGDKAAFPESRLALLSLLHRVGTDRRLDARGNMLLLLAPSLEEVHADLRAASSGIRAIEVPPPDHAARLAYVEERVARNGLRLEMRPEELAAQTAGLYRRHIEDVALRAAAAGGVVTRELVRARKRESIASEYAEVLEVLEPAFGFEAIGGHRQAKEFLVQWVIRPLREGLLDMVPLGVAFLGPPGTGKTVLAVATAKEAGLNCVLLRPEKIKGGIVGESERRLARALGGIESLAPCLVFVDELDQRFQRGGGGGDGGAAVESNLFGRLLEFFGDQSHRGRVVTITASNRPDLVDAALFRPGRFDVKIPLLPPETAEERAEVFAAALRRYGHADPERLPLAACGARTEGWTQAEIERAVVKANGLARLRGLPIGAALDEALALLRPATRDIQLMTALAVAECDDASLLPARYRALLEDRAALDAEIARRTADEATRGRGRQARSLEL
jgi:transitional endoplasmic reticulum ATPase